MQIKKGIPVSPGIAIYRAVVFDSEDQPIPRRTVPIALTEKEERRLDHALAESTAEIERMRDQTVASLGKLSEIFSAHIAMINDQSVIGQIRDMIRNERVTAEYAVYATFNRFTSLFQNHEIKSLRDRAADILDLEHRILKHLIGETRSDLTHLTKPAVIIAHDLTPSQTATLDKSKVKAISIAAAIDL